MRNFRTILVTLAFFGLSMSAAFAQHPPLGGGTGANNDPYLIRTPEHLAALATYVNTGNGSATTGKFYKLMNDIDLSGYAAGTGWNPIGDYHTTDVTTAFCGSFDGNGKVVRNLSINRQTQNYIGLFGLMNGGTLANLGVEDCSITAGGQITGGLVGYSSTNSNITACYTTGSIIGGTTTGGLVGANGASVVSNCYSTCNVIGGGSTGGLVGSSNADVNNSYATGNVNGTTQVGGLVGSTVSPATTTNCYATGNVTGTDDIGGLVGRNASGCTIQNCVVANRYVTRTANATTNVNRITGNNAGTTANNYADSSMLVRYNNNILLSVTNNQPVSGLAKNTRTLKSLAFYTATANWSGGAWNFTTVWNIQEAVTFPWLRQIFMTPHPALGGGTGTSGDPYRIETAAHLAELATYVNARNGCPGTAGKFYKLMNHIDLNGYATGAGWNPIGDYHTVDFTTAFCGNFDGNGKEVRNLTINRPMQSYVGLFGTVNGGTVANLGVKDCNVTGGQLTGSLSAYNTSSTVITNSYATGNVTGTAMNTGGLVGGNDASLITNCYATCNVTGTNNNATGGLVGASNSNITNSYATGNVSGAAQVGGLTGYNYTPAIIANCYATGNVTGTGNNIGGLLGENTAGCTVKNCVAANNSVIKTTSGSTTINRVIGSNPANAISLNNYAYNSMTLRHNTTESVPITDGSPAAGTGKDMPTLKRLSFYTEAANWNGGAWNFTTIWDICPGLTLFPYLRWENVDCGTLTTLHPPLGGGDGTSGNPYQIKTPEHLAELATYVNTGNGYPATLDNYYLLMNNLDLSGYASGEGWNPIGDFHTSSASNASTTFCGNFNGNNKVIRNVTINRPAQNYVGLFGTLNSGVIKNLDVECNIVGQSYTGGLVGLMGLASVDNCHVTGTVTGTTYTGGLVGQNVGPSITNSSATGSVSGFRGVGGLVGYSIFNATITNCYATNNVNGYQIIGGLVGWIENTAINNCHAAGNVSGAAIIGGLVGACPTGNSTVKHSFSIGSVSGNSEIGGLVGYNSAIAMSNCYATGNVSGNSNVGGLAGYNITNAANISYCYATGRVTGNGNHIGGLVGSNTNSSTVKNCVAANEAVIRTTGSNYINRVTGENSGTLQNNYAYSNMTVQHNNGVNVPITDGSVTAGTGKDMLTLKSRAFYTTAGNWNSDAWNLTTVWDICDNVTLPYLRWENINCGIFVPVTNIINVPATIMSGAPFTFTATVLPYNATHTNIVWSITNAGTTGATLNGATITATAQGTVRVTATIADGLETGMPYTQNFDIEVGMAYVPVTGITDLPTTAIVNTPLTLSGTVVPNTATCRVISWAIYNAGTTNATVNDNTFTATAVGTATVTAIIADGLAIGTYYTQNFTITVSEYVAVTEITNLPSTVIAGTPLTLSGTVVPNTATYQTISWSITNAGTTGATLNGNIFTATSNGTATVTATIANGRAIGIPFTMEFTIAVTVTHVAVRDIINLPSTSTAGTSLSLSGTVVPDNATYQTISWRIINAGTTDATINGNTFTAHTAGTARLTATIANGTAIGMPYTKEFDIIVSAGGGGINDITAKRIMVYPNPTTGEIRVTNYELQMGDIEIFDVMGRNVGTGFARSTNGEAVINIFHLPAGVYYLRIAGETAKVIKQ